MSKLMDWVMNTISDDDDLDEIEEQKEQRETRAKRDTRERREARENRDLKPASYDYPQSSRETSPGKSKVVNIHTTAQLKVVVMQPQTYDDAAEIVDHLKSKKPVIVNLEKLEKEIARKVVDFLSGAVYALDGNIQKVSNGIFLIAPYNVGIMGDFKDELRNKGIFPWNS